MPRSDRRALWWGGAVAAVVVFWANVHGSFILIYPLLGVGVLDGSRRVAPHR